MQTSEAYKKSCKEAKCAVAKARTVEKFGKQGLDSKKQYEWLNRKIKTHKMFTRQK